MKTLVKWITASLSVFLTIYGLSCICLTPSFDGGFLEREKCPACYGQSLCSNLTTPDNEIVLINDRWNILSLVNVRNVFFGSIYSHRVVFKKLGHNWELQKFDLNICNAYGEISERDMSMPCDSSLALQNIIRHYDGSVFEVIVNHPDVFESSDTLKCISRHRHVVDFLLEKFSEREGSLDVRENFLTVMAINPEPIILMAFGESESALPPLLGACGRVVVEQHVGTPLTHYADSPWIRRANYAVQLLQLATRFSDATVRLYLTDPRPDNFVVDERDKVWLADAENVVLVDSQTPLLDYREHVNDGLGCKDCLSFAFEDLCEHRSADHNFFAICKSLLSSTPFESGLPGGLLAHPPPWVTEVVPTLFELVELCSYPHNSFPYAQFRTSRGHGTLLEDLATDDQRGLPAPSDSVNNNNNNFIINHLGHSNTSRERHPVSEGENGDINAPINGGRATASGEREDEVAEKRVIREDAVLKALQTRRQAAGLLEEVLDQLIREYTARIPLNGEVPPNNEL